MMLKQLFNLTLVILICSTCEELHTVCTFLTLDLMCTLKQSFSLHTWGPTNRVVTVILAQSDPF